MNALKSNDEALRTAACTYLTPIIIKINKPALAFILQKFLQDYKAIEHKSIGTLESLMTLLKVARQNKMLVICDATHDIRLDENSQAELTNLQPEGTPEFSIL